MPYLEENKKVIVVGIPGVGKTSVVNKVVEILKEKNKSVSVVNFGSLMFEEAKKQGVQDRDDLRKLPMEKQKQFQTLAGKAISALQEDVIIIDTHLFISTPFGYYPGLPYHVLKVIEPSNLVSVSATPEEILNRRTSDETRKRDIISPLVIEKELSVQDAMLSTCAVSSGAPMKNVLNSEGKVEEAAESVIRAIGL